MDEYRDVVLTGSLSPSDKDESDYLHLPFQVPEGTIRVDVSYDYTRAPFARARTGDESVLDIGIFGPGDGSLPPVDSRGWSGGARSEFFVAEHDATPGYLPGPQGSGRRVVRPERRGSRR